MTSYWQALQKAIFNTFIASQNWFIPFAQLEEDAIKGILEDLWKDPNLRKQFLDCPYFVLRLLPYKHLLPPKGAQELTEAWQRLVELEMKFENESLKEIAKQINFSCYASQTLWKDGTNTRTSLNEQETKCLPAVMNILFTKFHPSDFEKIPFSKNIVFRWAEMGPYFSYRDPMTGKWTHLFSPSYSSIMCIFGNLQRDS